MPDLETTALGTPQKAFAGYPAPFVLDAPDGERVEHTIWGDYVGLTGVEDGDWVQVRARGMDGWMRRSEIQTERLLEVNFVDVGQGDGSFIVTPNDDYLLVDAGLDDNMLRFSWRFNLRFHYGWRIDFLAGVITHPDEDHFGGFAKLLDSGNFHFDALYHNGLVERAGGPRLGPTTEVDGITYQTDVVTDLAALHAIIDDPARVGGMHYPNLMKTAVDGALADDVAMLSEGGFVEGFGPHEDLSIQVLAPITSEIDGQPALRRLGDDGVTKNGHSVTLRLRYRDISVLLTGDLNSASQRRLLEWTTGVDPVGADDAERDQMVEAARAIFGSDVAKGCHHGSADFVDGFLGAMNALVTVVSSGDDEPFAHPRPDGPDALGALGKWGRGTRPLIFSTELARSARENIKQVQALLDELSGLEAALDAAPTEEERDAVLALIADHASAIERAIAVYGLINLRTDGRKLVMAQKLERPAPSGVKWDVHRFEFDGDGELRHIDD